MQNGFNPVIANAEYVSEGEVIYVDSGTATMHMISYPLEKKFLTIATGGSL